uniref:Uncharacterized protein n=1 Tax=Anguilla anguilla TaxID=7936 RepID=A0A0E9R3R5_ANGAN
MCLSSYTGTRSHSSNSSKMYEMNQVM